MSEHTTITINVEMLKEQGNGPKRVFGRFGRMAYFAPGENANHGLVEVTDRAKAVRVQFFTVDDQDNPPFLTITGKALNEIAGNLATLTPDKFTDAYELVINPLLEILDDAGLNDWITFEWFGNDLYLYRA